MKRFLVTCAAIALSGCFRPTTETKRGPNVIGPAGGEIDAGVVIVIPPGALRSDVTVTVESIATPTDVPGLPIGQAWRLGPEGSTFDLAVTLGLPLDPNGVTDVEVETAPDERGPFVALSTIVAGRFAWAHPNHFSVFITVQHPDAGADSDGGTDAGSLDAGADSDGGIEDDAGEPDAGPPDAGPFDAGSVCPAVPGWVDAGAPPMMVDGGDCDAFTVETNGVAGVAKRQCLSGSQTVTCGYPDCYCESESFAGQSYFSFPAPQIEASADEMLALWQCECGFPALTPDEPRCQADAGTNFSAPYSKPLGETCVDGTECQYAMCLTSTIAGTFCSKDCGIDGDCPCGFRCISISAGGNADVCVPWW